MRVPVFTPSGQQRSGPWGLRVSALSAGGLPIVTFSQLPSKAGTRQSHHAVAWGPARGRLQNTAVVTVGSSPRPPHRVLCVLPERTPPPQILGARRGLPAPEVCQVRQP